MKAIFIGLIALLSAFSTQADELETTAKYAYILDFKTNKTLFEKNADQLIAPASMSKLMTAYMVFEQLKLGKIKLDDEFFVSQTAFDRRGSSMFAQLKSKISVHNLLQGLIVVSGNDAAIALAEGLAGSEAAFAQQMQTKAQQLGLTESTFVNSTGWPDAKQLMTMRDLGQLAWVLIRDFPEYYHYFAQQRFKWGKVDQPNRNILLDDGIGVDGLKTGRTDESGHGIVASALRGERRVIIVLNGLTSASKRAAETRRLLEWAFEAFKNYKIYPKGAIVGQAQIAGGDVQQVNIVAADDIIAILNADNVGGLTGHITYNKPLIAPIAQYQEVAQLHLNSPSGIEHIVPLVAEKHVAKGGRVDQSIDILWSWVDKKLNSLF